MFRCKSKSKKKCNLQNCTWISKKLQYCKRLTTRNKLRTVKNRGLAKYGLRNEKSFLNALVSKNERDIIKWVCSNLDVVVEKHVKKTRESKFIIYRVGRMNPTFPGDYIDHKYIISGNKNYGSGSWGTVNSAYIFKPTFYKKKSIIELAKEHRRKGKRSFYNKGKAFKYTTAFWLLLKHDNRFFYRLIKENKNRYVIKTPNEMELDSGSLKDILFEPAIHGSLCLNEDVKKYLPEIKSVFILPKKKNWRFDCLNKSTDKIPKSIILSVMEKLDGSYFNILRKNSKHQLKTDKNFRMNKEELLSYILQISLALHNLYKKGMEFNHRDLKTDNLMYVNTEDVYFDVDINVDKSIGLSGVEKKLKFQFKTYGYMHKIIDFGLSCTSYRGVKLNSTGFFEIEDPCFSRSRDLTQLIYILLNVNWNILDDDLIGYFGSILDITSECKLWMNLLDTDVATTTDSSVDISISSDEEDEEDDEESESGMSFNEKCAKINDWDSKLYRLLDAKNYDNKKAYPEKIINDIYEYTLKGTLPRNKECIEKFKEFRRDI